MDRNARCDALIIAGVAEIRGGVAATLLHGRWSIQLRGVDRPTAGHGPDDGGLALNDYCGTSCRRARRSDPRAEQL